MRVLYFFELSTQEALPSLLRIYSIVPLPIRSSTSNESCSTTYLILDLHNCRHQDSRTITNVNNQSASAQSLEFSLG